jgi:hypothetical protein
MRISRLELLYLSIWWIFMFAIWSRMLVFDGTHYWAGWINVWGDWTAHITYIMNLAFRPLPLTSHPLYVGELFRYHFAADLLSALLIRTGATLIQATIIPSILFSCILVTCAYIFYRSVFGRKETGFIATALFSLMVDSVLCTTYTTCSQKIP